LNHPSPPPSLGLRRSKKVTEDEEGYGGQERGEVGSWQLLSLISKLLMVYSELSKAKNHAYRKDFPVIYILCKFVKTKI